MAANNENANSVFNLNSTNDVVAPEQTSMFASDAEATRMDIGHDQGQNPQTSEQEHEEEVSTGTKAKILAALAIVGIAGYIAYWVQEPIQLRTAVIDGETSTEETAPATTDESATVADASEAPKGPSVSVDVSLFGFEPATLKIDKGTTVIWTNTSTEDQTIIGSSPEGESFVSPVLTSGQSFSYKFDLDSSFEYYSTYNPALKATITVGLGSPSAATIESPDSATTTASPESATSPVTNEDLMGAAPETSSEMVDKALNDALAAANAIGTTTVDTAAPTASAEEITAAALDDLKPAAPTPSKLTKTGPTETLYAFALITIAWFNRKKLAKVFQK